MSSTPDGSARRVTLVSPLWAKIRDGPHLFSPSAISRASSTCCVECTKCDRKGRYSVAKLIAKHGRKGNMSAWVSDLKGDCPKRDGRLTDRCDLICPYKGKSFSGQDSKLWERVIAEDFAEFRKANLTHPMMADIEEELGVSPDGNSDIGKR
jgi:hypothetical protein